MIIEYNMQQAYQNEIDIVNIGEFALRGSNDGVDYIVAVRASFGKAKILKYGPVLADTCLIANNFNLTYREIDFKETSIISDVSKYLNDVKKEITEVVEIDISEALGGIPSIENTFMED